MGAITRIREISPYALGVFAVLFIAFMVIGDSSCSTISQQQQSPDKVAIAEINGEEIMLAEYEQRVKEYEERVRQSGQQLDNTQIRQQVFDMMVQEVLRKQQAADMGLVLTPEEIIDVMLINPPAELQFFKDSTGRFQKELYQDLVTNPSKIVELLTAQGAPPEEAERERVKWVSTLTQIEDGIRMQKIEEALRSAVGAAASIPSLAAAEREFITQNSTASVQYIAIPADLVADEAVTVSDKEIEAYYEKNKQYYEQRPARGVKYVVIRQEPGKKDSARALKRSVDLQETFGSLPEVRQRDSAFSVKMNEYSGQSYEAKPVNEIDASLVLILKSLETGDVFGPLTQQDGVRYIRLDAKQDGTNPTVRASHILFSFNDDKEASKAEAEAVMKRAKGGEDFATLAQQYSKDPGSGQNGGDLNYFGKGAMVPEFEEAAFAASVGDIVGSIETQFGWHIIKVTDRVNLELAYSEIVVRPLLSNATRQENIVRASKIEEELNDGNSIDTVGKAYGLEVSESQLFQRKTPFLGSAAITAWAFDADKGDVMRETVEPYGIVVAQLTEIRHAGVKELKDMTDEIKRKLVQRKKLDNLKTLASQVSQACKSAGNMEAYKQVDSTLELRVMANATANGQLQGFGGEFTATAAAFKLPLNTISEPIRGQRAWFVMMVDSKVNANMADFTANKVQHLQNQSQRTRSSAYFGWMQNVQDNAEIIDLRDRRN